MILSYEDKITAYIEETEQDLSSYMRLGFVLSMKK